MEPSDALINGDHPVVQEHPRDGHIELVLPREDVTVVMEESVFMSVFGQGMRIITGE